MRLLEFGFVASALALPVFAADIPTAINPPSLQRLKEISPSELKIVPTAPEASAPVQKESARPSATPEPAASRTAEEASEARAANPKDTSGAIIIKVPVAPGARP